MKVRSCNRHIVVAIERLAKLWPQPLQEQGALRENEPKMPRKHHKLWKIWGSDASLYRVEKPSVYDVKIPEAVFIQHFNF